MPDGSMDQRSAPLSKPARISHSFLAQLNNRVVRWETLNRKSHFVTLLLLSASAVAVFYFSTKKGKRSFSLAPVSHWEDRLRTSSASSAIDANML